ncbi:MAG TPA: isopentenyl-diphosphate Delta-isomerase [Pyrinomonadaceae bacterium]|nr:isopentenyl-diphosphate Delta-isomerase [Pyrinomonadaceae bacterium]
MKVGNRGAGAGAAAMEQVILVDEHDRELGAAEKLSAHAAGRLHRAFSIFVFNSAGRLLLQRRAKGKYHSGGLWSNTCCGHPRPEESTPAAARRRLREEMNFDCELSAAFEFLYRAEFANELIEHEYDHVFVGEFDGAFTPEESEVEEWKWTTTDELRRDLRERPEEYTYWLRAALETEGWARVEEEYGTGREARGGA